MIRTGLTSDNRDEWLAARRNYLCSSEVAGALGQAEWLTRAQVVMNKAGFGDEWSGNEQTEMGNELEPAIARIAERRWGWRMTRWAELVVDAHCPYLAATPDYLVATPWGNGCVQIKLTTCQAQEDCRPRKNGEPSTAAYAGGPPIYHQLQQTAELAVMGLEWSALLVLHTCAPHFKLRAYALRRNELAIAKIRRTAEEVMLEVEALKAGRLAV